ncbi:MAG: hypothetical protein K0R30_1852 [Ornithinibacter sp.]|nr:hypothetical protein [Ornithinibacter sp.]
MPSGAASAEPLARQRGRMPADITLRGPGDVLAVLPYQLGYHPRDSIIAISLRGRRVGLVVRTDLPLEGEVEATVTLLVEPLVRDGATSVLVVGYEDEPDASSPALVALVEQVERKGIDVVDVVVVRDGRRYSPICSDPCCPPDGIALPDPADVPGVAEFVARGRSPLVSRDAVEALVAPDPSACKAVGEALLARAGMPGRRGRSAAAWRVLLRRERTKPGDRGAGGPPQPSAPVVADAVLGLADIAWRDGLVAWLAPGVLPAGLLDSSVLTLLRRELPTWAGMGLPHRPRRGRRLRGAEPYDDDGVERQELLQRLLALCRSVPDEHPDEAAALCTVTAHVAWESGDGAVARAAVDRARRLAPGYRLAQLLERLVEHGVRLPADGGRDGPATAWVG